MKSRLAIAGIATLLAGVSALPAHAGPAAAIDPDPIARFSSAVTTGPDGRIYAFGGHYQGGSYVPLAHAEVLDPSTDTAHAPAWKALPPMPTARAGASAVVASGPDGRPRIFVIGGYAYATPLATVEVYDPEMHTWAAGRSMATPRGYFAAATGHDGLIYAIGGYNGAQALAVVEVYDPRLDSWLPPPQGGYRPMPTARYCVASTLGLDGRIYVFGGSPGVFTVPTVEAYDPAGNSWTTLHDMARSRYAAAAATALDGRMFVIGGHEPSTGDDGARGDIEIFDGTAAPPVTSTTTVTPRFDLGAAVDAQGRIYTIGGFRTGEVNTVERFAP